MLDQALALFGLPEAITAQCSIMREGSNNVDHFDLTLHYPGHVAVLHADLFSAHPNQRFTIKGSKGSYVKIWIRSAGGEANCRTTTRTTLLGR
ncbi:hypothetical protein QW180_01360 [Vibrio sinaloensis]|nr:hypothetical protein [Vibrio sinaloensis]